MPNDITIRKLQVINAGRAQRWHDGADPWGPMEWGCAIAGEVGEACNLAKKLQRQESGMKNPDSRGKFTDEEYRKMIGKELADAVIYAVLFADCVGIDLQDAVREVFNAKSIENDFPERL